MKRALATALILFSPVTLAACSSEMDHSSHQMPSNSSAYSADELMFAQMMIPHHEQALEMVALAEAKTTNKEILHVAGHIKTAQAPEVATMTSWLTAAGMSPDDSHDMPMEGMLSEAEMNELQEASGTEFEILFLQGMIKHHEGALSMLSLLAKSNNTEVTSFGDMIRKVQSKEIIDMQELLKKY